MRIGRAVGAAALTLVAILAACGDDGDGDARNDGDGDAATGGVEEASSEQRQEYVDALVAIAEDGDPAFTVEHRTCMAESFVDGFGAAEMAEAGVTPEDITNGEQDGPSSLGLEFSDEQSADFYDRMSECMDVRALFLEGLASDGDMPQEAVDCIDENLSDDLLERFFTTGFTQGDAGFEANPELEQEFDDAVLPCMALSGP